MREGGKEREAGRKREGMKGRKIGREGGEGDGGTCRKAVRKERKRLCTYVTVPHMLVCNYIYTCTCTCTLFMYKFSKTIIYIQVHVHVYVVSYT